MIIRRLALRNGKATIITFSSGTQVTIRQLFRKTTDGCMEQWEVRIYNKSDDSKISSGYGFGKDNWKSAFAEAREEWIS